VCILLAAWGLLVAVAAAATEVTATRLDGTTVVGSLAGWDQSKINILTRNGAQSLETSGLQSLAWTPSASLDAAAASPQSLVELVDGSVLPVADFQRSGDSVSFVLRGGEATSNEKITLPLKLVSSVRLQPLDNAAAMQWNEIRSEDLSADVLVVLSREGKSLDYHEGVLGDITSDRVKFKLEEENFTEVDRGRVAGVIYFRAKPSIESDPHCIVTGRGGFRAKASKVALKSGRLQLTTVAGAELEWPIEDIQFADFSAGKIVFLSDLEPASAKWTPLIGIPDGATLASTYGRPRRDESAFGAGLSLWLPGDDPSVPAGQIKKFSKGLALRSRTELTYRLPRGYRKLLAVAGIEPTTRSNGAARLTIHGDDRVLMSTEIVGKQDPSPIELDIAGVKRIEITVEHGQNLDTGDWLNLCDARIVK
jgi:hypothetical protein